MCNYFQSAGDVNLDTLSFYSVIDLLCHRAHFSQHTQEVLAALTSIRGVLHSDWLLLLSRVPGGDASGTGSWCRWSEVAQNSRARRRAKKHSRPTNVLTSSLETLPFLATSSFLHAIKVKKTFEYMFESLVLFTILCFICTIFHR